MDKKTKNLIEECLLFINGTSPSKIKKGARFDEHVIEMYRSRISHALIERFSIDLERNADTGDLVYDGIEDEPMDPDKALAASLSVDKMLETITSLRTELDLVKKTSIEKQGILHQTLEELAKARAILAEYESAHPETIDGFVVSLRKERDEYLDILQKCNKFTGGTLKMLPITVAALVSEEFSWRKIVSIIDQTEKSMDKIVEKVKDDHEKAGLFNKILEAREKYKKDQSMSPGMLVYELSNIFKNYEGEKNS